MHILLAIIMLLSPGQGLPSSTACRAHPWLSSIPRSRGLLSFEKANLTHEA